MNNEEYKTLKDQLYCQQFELETLADIVTRDRLERMIPGFCNVNTEIEHTVRYEWAAEFAKQKEVLDIASGTGYGSHILATKGNAKQVHGCDLDEKSVKYASIKYAHPHVSFETGNAEDYIKEKTYDLVASFETIEHLQHPEKFLEHMSQSLKQDGILLVSTPISRVEENKHPYNPYHVTEWGFKRFQEVVGAYFEVEKVYVQLYPFYIAKKDVWKSILPHRIHRLGDTIKYVKAKLAQTPKESLAVSLRPKEWSEELYPTRMLGKDILGTQILVCKKKKGT